jgi:hypothetical protein
MVYARLDDLRANDELLTACQLSRILNRFLGSPKNDRLSRVLHIHRKIDRVNIFTRCIRPRSYRDSGCRTGGGDRMIVIRLERTPEATEVPHTDRQSVMAPNLLGVEPAPFFTL